MPQFTTIEQRILKVLSDGMLHGIDELIPCLQDSQGEANAVHQHIFRIRKKLNAVGQHISCETNGNAWTLKYRHVILLDPHAE